MNSTLVKIVTKNHRGQLVLTIDFDIRGEGDLISSVHTHPKVSLENHIDKWQFKNRKRIILRPFAAFDEASLGPKQAMIDVDKAAWQPEAVYVQFFSQDGCSFSLTANYKEEEEMREKRQN